MLAVFVPLFINFYTCQKRRNIFQSSPVELSDIYVETIRANERNEGPAKRSSKVMNGKRTIVLEETIKSYHRMSREPSSRYGLPSPARTCRWPWILEPRFDRRTEECLDHVESYRWLTQHQGRALNGSVSDRSTDRSFFFFFRSRHSQVIFIYRIFYRRIKPWKIGQIKGDGPTFSVFRIINRRRCFFSVSFFLFLFSRWYDFRRLFFIHNWWSYCSRRSVCRLLLLFLVDKPNNCYRRTLFYRSIRLIWLKKIVLAAELELRKLSKSIWKIFDKRRLIAIPLYRRIYRSLLFFHFLHPSCIIYFKIIWLRPIETCSSSNWITKNRENRFSFFRKSILASALLRSLYLFKMTR